MKQSAGWSQKTSKQKASIFIILGIVLLVLVAGAVAITALVGSQSKTIANWKGHTFSIELENVATGSELVPEQTQRISPTVSNTSPTERVYVFMKLDYNSSVYSNKAPTGWYLLDSASHLYAYGTDSEMTEVAIGGSATLDTTLKVIASGSAFEALTNQDMKVVVTAYGISSAVSRNTPSEAWQDYQAGGNAAMIQALSN